MAKRSRVTRQDFEHIHSTSVKRYHGEFFSLVVITASGTKFTCVVSKKIAARAVERNRIKRRCREAARAALGSTRHEIAFVFYAKRQAREAAFAAIKKDVETLIKKSRG